MSSFCQRIVQAPWFQRLVLALILMAGALVGLETSPQLMQAWGPWFRWIDSLVLTLFVLELLIRIGAYGPRPWRFFTESWNVFDFVIVTLSLLPFTGHTFAVLRLARVLRVLRLITAVPRLQILVGALLKSLPSMSYVGLLLALLFYVYAVVGVKFFGPLDPGNFGNLGRAAMTLFEIVTLEGWVDILERQLELHASPFVPVTYFVTFILIGTMVVLNLLIGVIVNGMDEARREMEHEDRLRHQATLGKVTVQDDVAALQRQVQALQDSLAALRHRLK
jgi:voltage-gated sodium channel